MISFTQFLVEKELTKQEKLDQEFIAKHPTVSLFKNTFKFVERYNIPGSGKLVKNVYVGPDPDSGNEVSVSVRDVRTKYLKTNTAKTQAEIDAEKKKQEERDRVKQELQRKAQARADYTGTEVKSVTDKDVDDVLGINHEDKIKDDNDLQKLLKRELAVLDKYGKYIKIIYPAGSWEQKQGYEYAILHFIRVRNIPGYVQKKEQKIYDGLMYKSVKTNR